MEQNYFKFNGKGQELFLIYLKNFFLSIITLGVYIPWAIVNVTKFIYSHASFKDKRFDYHGKGIEILKGFLMFLIVFVLFILIFSYVASLNDPILTIALMLLFYVGIFTVLPFIWYSALKYDNSRTTYNGIRFGFRADKQDFVKTYFSNLLFLILTLGFYGSWFSSNMHNYITKNTRLGSVEFSSETKGLDLFLINLKGILLTLVTLGIYSFWWMKNIFKFWVESIQIHHQGQNFQMKSKIEAGDIFILYITNLFLIAFTLGFGMAWANVRTYKFIIENCFIEGEIDVDSIEQTEENLLQSDDVRILDAS